MEDERYSRGPMVRWTAACARPPGTGSSDSLDGTLHYEWFSLVLQCIEFRMSS